MYHQLAVWCRNRPQPNARRLDRSDSRARSGGFRVR